jgi:hypothetical protein
MRSLTRIWIAEVAQAEFVSDLGNPGNDVGPEPWVTGLRRGR